MSIALAYRTEALPLSTPIQISGYRFVEVPVLQVSLRDGSHEGRGEAAGVYYLNDRPADMASTIESVRSEIEVGIDRQSLRR